MRSKPKARRVNSDGLEDAGLSAELEAYEEAVDNYGSHLMNDVDEELPDDDDDDDNVGALVIADVDPESEADEDKDDDVHPVYIPEDIHIPPGFELAESGVFSGLGVWTQETLTEGQRFGPFEGKMKSTVDNPTSAWELVDDCGKVKGWIDASQPGTGNWLKYVRSTADPAQQNLMAVQVDDQVFYKAVRDISIAEELLLYEQDAAYPEKGNQPTNLKQAQQERQFSCDKCGDVFRSKVALRRHETYVCNNRNAIFTLLNRNFRPQQQTQQRPASELQQARSELEKVLRQQQLPSSSHTRNNIQHSETDEEEIPVSRTSLGVKTEKIEHNSKDRGSCHSQLKQALSAKIESNATVRHAPTLQRVLKATQPKEELTTPKAKYPRDKPSTSKDTSPVGVSVGGNRKGQADTSGQSEEMIQTGAAEDRSALGSPSSQDTQPYSIIDSVTGLRSFPCENCDKQFTDPSNLQRHIRSQHVGARSHACPECGKTFATSSGLKQHQHIHSSVKPFQCEVCLKAYTQFSNLCRHKRMHADCRQQIKCKDCGQAFSTMTSLSKHKRFCEGMLRPNGQQRIGYPGLGAPPSGAAGEKAQIGSLMNAQSPTSALASYMSLYQQPQRPPFPFYPPAFGGAAGFPLFPGSHPAMGGSLGASLGGGESGEKLRSLSGAPLGARSPRSPGATDLHGQTGDTKREKNASEGSEADSSDVSSASDLDTSTGSDMDSEFHQARMNRRKHGRPAHHPPAPGGVQIVNSHTRLAKSPLTASAPPAAHHTPTSRDEKAHSATEDHHDEDEDNAPFDLSKSSSSPSTPVSFTTSGGSSGDQPLDLSVRSKGSDSTTSTPKSTPRKTHIFGSSGKGSASTTKSDNSEEKHTPSSTSGSARPASSSSPELPPSPVSAATSTSSERASSERDRERGLHYAYPSLASPVVIEPMYRVDKEKPQSYHDVVARMMAYGPPRLPPMHHAQSHLNFPGLQGGMGGLLSPARPDAAKLLPPMLGKTPDHHFGYHHGTGGVNKLKERYACKFCGKIFPRSANLTRHLRTHTGEQPYKCKYCERSFSISSNLQRHVRNIHNKEKPFKCPLCDRCFGQQTNLDRHLKKHESDDPTMLDSPLGAHEQELEEKDESYFDEIRNFIGKATAESGNGDRSLVNGRVDSDLSMKNDGLIDSHFSLTGQIVEKRAIGEKRPAEEDEDDEELIDDDGSSDSSGGEGGIRSSSPSQAKKARIDNNNIATNLSAKGSTSSATITPTAATDDNAYAGNGFHEEEDELEEDMEEEEVIDDEEQPVALTKDSTGSSLQLNGVNKAPMACSS